MSDNLEKLYEKYNTLSDAKENVSQYSKEYVASFEGIKGNENEKMLAAQILSKFFKHFPDLQEKALNGLLDLCEDEEARIRACAMRYLVSICTDVREHIVRVTDILAQMMQLDEQRDFTTATWCIQQLWKEDAISVLKTLFNHIQMLTNAGARSKCLKFIHTKLIKPGDLAKPEIETIVVDESKKFLQLDITSDEIFHTIKFLSGTKYYKTLTAQQELIDLLGELIEFDQEFDPLEEFAVDKVIMCTTHVLPLFSAKNESTKFVMYYCDHVLPQWEKIATLPQGELLQYQLLRHLAELSSFCGKLDNPTLYVEQIFDKIKQYMPSPPENADVYKMPNFEFSFVECLLYAFHRLARQCPDFLTQDPEVLKEFRARLVYFSRGVQGCNKVLSAKSFGSMEKSTAVKAQVAPTILNNINTLIKDLFHQPPIYKCNVTLSFKGELATIVKDVKKPTEGPQKRHVPITFDSGSNGSTPKQARNRSGDNVKLYTPPSGKFSNNFGNYERNRSGRGRGRGGRGRSRNWRN